MFSKSDVLVINKMDLPPHVDFGLPALKKAVRKLKPGVVFIEMSAKTGDGVDKCVAWLEQKLRARRKSR
jgi:hydrogenase nickel incorporation protein HypB